MKCVKQSKTGGRFGYHADRVAEVIATSEKSHTCQSMKGRDPRDCLTSAYLHLLAKHSHGGTDTEVHGRTGTENITASACGAWLPVCSVCAGLHGIHFIFFFILNFMVILCLNVYPQFIVYGIQTL